MPRRAPTSHLTRRLARLLGVGSIINLHMASAFCFEERLIS